MLAALAWTPPAPATPGATTDPATATTDPTAATVDPSIVIDLGAGATTPADATNAPAANSASPLDAAQLAALTNLPADATNAPAANPTVVPPPPPVAIPVPALSSDHPRPALAPLPPNTGAATFAAPAPPPAATPAIDAATAATATTATVAPPPPAEQLVSVLTPLRTTQSGTYTLRLELKPPELGRVEIRVEMRDGVLHASIHADHESSAQMMRDALSDLRDRLGAEGVQTGELTVSDGGVGSGSPDGRDAPPASSTSTAGSDLGVTGDAAIAPTLESEATSLLDVRV